jgi:16S rRNA C1402 N4-methylase RsmH
MTMDDAVQQRIRATWLEPLEQERVASLLAEYGQESHEREAARVQLAILKLSEGQAERVAELVTAAKRDYRDVLMWAEYPEEGRALWALRPNLTAEERDRLSRIRQRDREQYLKWLRKE